MPTYGPEMEGKTATSKDGKTRIIIRNGEAVRDDSYRPSGAAQVTTTNADMKALADARDTAQAERDATRTYLRAAKAIDDFGDSGPWKATLLDAGAPGQSEEAPDRGWAANVLGPVASLPMNIAGGIYRAFTPRKTLTARDTLRTIGAQGALAQSSKLKGTASNADMALIRTAGLQPSKYPEENRRIVNQAITDGGLAQTRALVTQNWIATNGSQKAKDSAGHTLEDMLQLAEASYARHFAERQAARRQPVRSLPQPPPSVRKSASASRVPVIDMNGNPAR